ncbi:MAG: DUF2461 family protein [Oscillospiraceae bacterium]|nr:DUF2461 family protein [Oscillospiraceae bacterium]
MFKGFSKEALEFLCGIRDNNNKEWFEANKQIYLDAVYHPMKELCEELYKPFSDIPTMMAKAGRIYRDEFYPPYKKYREDMWIVVRHEAFYWSRTPSLFFELSGDGATFGFRIAKPEAGVMELFRKRITEAPDYFMGFVRILEEDFGVTFGGDEYKRPKPCSVEGAERFFNKKGLTAFVTVTNKRELFGTKLVKHVSEVFDALFPLNEMFHDIVGEYQIEKAKQLAEASLRSEPEMPKAPQTEFMW